MTISCVSDLDKSTFDVSSADEAMEPLPPDEAVPIVGFPELELIEKIFPPSAIKPSLLANLPSAT